MVGRIFASEIWGAYFREGLFLGGLIIAILWYNVAWIKNEQISTSSLYCYYSVKFK